MICRCYFNGKQNVEILRICSITLKPFTQKSNLKIFLQHIATQIYYQSKILMLALHCQQYYGSRITHMLVDTSLVSFC